MPALLKLSDVSRQFEVGKEKFAALKGVNLEVQRGEFVALVGASGSGKSTLMNILGCLDTPTSGTYCLSGRDITAFDADELAELRRRYFGFVFQRYHLLNSLSAISNVEVPAIYNGLGKARRRANARHLLARLGLEDRLDHRPHEMSGGQQQRVSIARALMNGGEVILADEPTGALDSKSGANVLALLKDLHQDGHTIIIVTHDLGVAKHADRVVELNDGQIVSDRHKEEAIKPTRSISFELHEESSFMMSLARRALDAAEIALRSIAAHRLRSFLTLFGIVVGISAVIAVVGLGEGGQRIVVDQINSLGANSISILPGKGWDDQNARNVNTLTPDDAVALATQEYVDNVSPLVKDTGQITFEGRTVDGVINGVSNAYFEVANFTLAKGTLFSSDDESRSLQEAIIDDNARKTFFGDMRDPIGEVLVLKGAPFVIVGTIGELRGALGQDKRPQVHIPYTSMFSRISGSQRLSEIVVRVDENVDSGAAERALTTFLEKRHGTRDFFTFNSDQMRRTIQSTTRTLSILVASIAAVALVVGGVGVMNIMLVSITERTNEIGLRMAVGARPIDVMMQFLIEALVVTIIGCCAGVALAIGFGSLANHIGTPIPVAISSQAIFIGCVLAIVIGMIFGYFPARKAARLKPVEALARD